jgi:putative ABC transport system permease protein
MAHLRVALHRFRGLFRKRALEAEMAAELAGHFDALVERHIAAGLSPAAARRAAAHEFGGTEQVKEQCREQRSWVWLEQLGKDVRFTIRSLLRARTFTLTVLATLGLGLGTATLVFDLTFSVIFSDPHPGLSQLGLRGKRGNTDPFQAAIQFQAYQQLTGVFAEFAAVTRDVANVVVDGTPAVANVIGVAPDCFRVLGVQPRLGRGFTPQEHQPGGGSVVVITDLFWRRTLQADPNALGRTIVVDQKPCTVVGVLRPVPDLPAGFAGDIYRPIVVRVDPANPLAPGVFLLARLHPGVTPAQAEAAMAAVKLPELPTWASSFLADFKPVVMRSTAMARPEIFWVVAVAGVLLYLMAILNAANLMLVRLLGRGRELCIRLALGGSRAQIARLLLLESFALALAAAAVVLVLVWALFPVLAATVTGNEAVRYLSFVDGKSLLCVGALALLAMVVVALVPVWRLGRSDVNLMLKDGGLTATESGRVGRVRLGLIVGQAALAVVLLAGTGLMLRSFERLSHVNLGFDPVGRVKVSLSFPSGYDANPERRLQLFEKLRNRVAALPGVRAVASGQDSLLIGGFWGTAQLLMPDGRYEPVAGNFVSADYLKAGGMVLKRGRWLSGRRGQFEAVVNETFAKARFGQEDPIGKSFRLLVSGAAETPVVGVVADVKETVRSAPGMRFYVADWAYPLNLSTLVVQLDRPPPVEFAGLVRKAIYEVDPRLIASDVVAVDEIVARQMWAEHNAYRILRGLSAISLVLAIVGLFSVIAYSVDTRMKEFGVRLALGARPANLHRLVLRRGFATAGLGIALGFVGALGLTQFMRSLLFETKPYDPLVYLAVALVLLAAAGLAGWLPARRAARVDVTRLLRTE